MGNLCVEPGGCGTVSVWCGICGTLGNLNLHALMLIAMPPAESHFLRTDKFGDLLPREALQLATRWHDR